MSPNISRRDVVIGGAAATLAAGAAASEAAPQAVNDAVTMAATGRVTETGGDPLSGVLVSNGRDVVGTDPDGRWRLPVVPGQTIVVIKPAGFAAPLDARTNLPKLFHVHDPEGTPASLGFRYRGLPPTGPLPASIDVVLTAKPESARFDVVLFADPQPESSVEVDFIREDAVAPLVGGKAETKPAFGMTLGDLAFDDLTVYGRLNGIVGRIGIPWWVLGGNHDLDYEAPDAARSRDTWKRVFGAPYHAHHYGGALFVMLDNVDYLGAGTGKAGEHGAYRGHISDDQLLFVENLLAATPPETLIVFAMHIPLRTYLDPAAASENTDNTADLLRLIGERPSVSFAGHTHTCEHHYLGAADGGSDAHPHHHHVLAAVSGSWWSGPLDHRGIACADQTDGTPNGHHVLSIDGVRYTTRFVPAAEPADRQMRIALDVGYHADDREVLRTTTMNRALRSPITAEAATAARLTVNLFDGGPRSSVRFTVDGGAATTMTRVARPDPFVAQLYGRYPETLKPWVKPGTCSHLWQSPLPALSASSYTLRVQATDEYGREHEDGMVLEVI